MTSADRPPGFLIAFEGIDGSGKSTQVRLLAEWLRARGVGVTALREPTAGPFGQKIRRAAEEGRQSAQWEFEMFLADREEDVRQNISPALERGDVVLMDRYYVSSIAYQGAAGLEPEAIRRANEEIAPRPDLVFLFEAPLDVALGRVAARRAKGPDHFEQRESLMKVQAQFDALDWPEIVRVDATLPMDRLHEVIRAETARRAAPLLT